MIPAFIAMGSNIEPRLKYLTLAVNQLQKLGTVLKIAPLYRSHPYGVKPQPDFLNSACILSTKILPLDFLEALKDIEQKLGRRKTFRWGPREIDLDIILYGDKIINKRGLIIPHPGYKERRFVLLPLVDIDANFMPPAETKTLKELLNDCGDETKVKLEIRNWYR